MTSKNVTNSVSKFGGILITPIWLTAVACYASAFLSGARMYPLHLLKPSTNTSIYTDA